MADSNKHREIAMSILESVREECSRKRYPAVGLLAIKCLEEVVEACVSKVGLHYHERPKTAHRLRQRWLAKNHPGLKDTWDYLWTAYGRLGYLGEDGTIADEALGRLSKAVKLLAEREKLG